jgi:hypothetical protein
MIYFDLDEVIRDLSHILYGRRPSKYDTLIDGKSVIDYVNENPILCEQARPAEYLDLLNSRQIGYILSAQPHIWRPYTNRWIDKHITIPCFAKYVLSPDEKLLFLWENDWLVDDSPQFSNYDQIILVDRPYNQDIDCEYRVKTPNELKQLLSKLEN